MNGNSLRLQKWFEIDAQLIFFSSASLTMEAEGEQTHPVPAVNFITGSRVDDSMLLVAQNSTNKHRE